MSYIFWKLSPTAFRLFAKCTQLTHLLCQFNLYCIYLTNITAQCKCLQRPQKSHRLSDSWPFVASPHLKMYFFLLEKIVPGSAGCISLLVRPRNSTWSKPSSVLRLLGMATFFDDHKVCLFVISTFYRNHVYLGSNLWVTDCQSVAGRPFWYFTDVTLADEDTNSVRTDNAKGNLRQCGNSRATDCYRSPKNAFEHLDASVYTVAYWNMVFSDDFLDFSLHWYAGLSYFFFHCSCIFLLIGFDTHI